MNNLAPGTEAAPSLVYAFFDVDQTILTGKSMFSFQEYWYRRGGADQAASGAERDRFLAEMSALAASGASREEVNRRYYEFYADRDAREVADCARAWFKQDVLHDATPYRTEVVDVLREHQRAGIRPVFVSGSLLEILLPLAAELLIDDLLCTRLEVVAGRFTGRILPPQMIGTGKAKAVRDFMRARGAEPDRCHAYGDDISDVPMLECVGRPHAVAGSAALERHARQRGWDVLA